MSRIEIGFLRDGFEVFTSVLELIGMILWGTGQQFPLGSERWSFLVKTHVGSSFRRNSNCEVHFAIFGSSLS